MIIAIVQVNKWIKHTGKQYGCWHGQISWRYRSNHFLTVPWSSKSTYTTTLVNLDHRAWNRSYLAKCGRCTRWTDWKQLHQLRLGYNVFPVSFFVWIIITTKKCLCLYQVACIFFCCKLNCTLSGKQIW